MTASAKGLLLAMMEPPSALEEEFNDWYDLEHLPERASIAGFETALRFTCVQGFPRYLAVYDLTDVGVLEAPAYQAVAYANFSPWTRRIQARTRGRYRAIASQVHPGQAPTGRLAQLTVVRFRAIERAREGELIQGLQRDLGARDETTQVRLFRAEGEGRVDYLGLAEHQAPCASTRLDLAAYGASRAQIDLVNSYVPYWRQQD